MGLGPWVTCSQWFTDLRYKENKLRKPILKKKKKDYLFERERVSVYGNGGENRRGREIIPSRFQAEHGARWDTPPNDPDITT